MRRTNLITTAIILAFAFVFAGSASGQYQIPQPPRPQVQCQGVPQVQIRNLPYSDYTRYSRLASRTVAAGGYLQISTSCMSFDGQIVVTLQDAARPNGYGVTALRLTNVYRSGSTITAQVPTYPVYRNRTYYVALFVFGQPWKTANPGTITIQ